MKYVFIDTNVLLNGYSGNVDYIPLLQELIDLNDDNKINIQITEQVRDEFYRQRESVLNDSLKSIKELGEFRRLVVPAFCLDIKKIKTTKYHYNKIKPLSKKAYYALIDKIKKESLGIDKLFRKILKKTDMIPVSNDIIDKAKRRMDRGNPPGKWGSYGDAINWEILMKNVPDGEDLYFIVVDKDYMSKIDDKDFSPFLKKEWKSRKKSEIVFYKSISEFLRVEFKKKKITQEQIKKEEVGSSIISVTPEWTPVNWGHLQAGSAAPLFASSAPPGVVSPGIWSIEPSVFGSVAAITSGTVGSNVSVRTCMRCGRVFESDVADIYKRCPYCGYLS